MAESTQEMPERGELVLAATKQITTHGVYVTLDEYDDLPAFLHKSEISTGWVRNIHRFIKEGQKIILKVIRVNVVRKEVDLTLRNVTGEERKTKLMEIRKHEKGNTIFDTVKNKLGLTSEEDFNYREKILDKFNGLYEASEILVTKGVTAFEELNLPENFISTLEQISKEKVVLPTVTIKGIISFTCKKSNGLEVIKEVSSAAKKIKIGGSEVKIIYLAAPKYQIIVTSKNFKSGEKALDAALKKMKDVLDKHKERLTFTRKETKKKGID